MRRLEDHELRRRRKGIGSVNSRGYIVVAGLLQHRIIAERILGRPLPRRVVVHHVNGDCADNNPNNLVICPNQHYHRLIHQREDALRATGHAHWRKCVYCKVYDDPQNDMFCTSRKAWHRKCSNEHRKQRRKAQ